MARLLIDIVDSKITHLNKRLKLKKSLTKYVKALPDFFENKVNNNSYKNKIWTMWLQGYDNAPPIVKTCIIA